MWHLKGRLYKSKSDHKSALKAYEKAYAVNLNDPFAQRALAHAYTQANRYDEALILVDKILVRTPEDPFAKLLRSQLLASTDHNEEANQLLIDISQKLSLLTDEQKHNNVALAYIAGTAAYIQNDLELAQEQLLFYNRENPQNLATINMLVNIYLHQGQLSKAQDLLESQEKLIANDLLLSLKLIDIYLNNRKLYKVESLLKSLEDEHKNNDQFIIAKVNWLTKTERYDQAITLLNQHQPKTFNAAFLLTKGLVYRAKKQLINAHDIADILLSNDPANIDFLSFKGSLLLDQQLWQQAISVFEKILINTPEHFSSLFNSATAYAALQQFESATKITNNLIKSHPEHLPLKILVAKLDQDTGNIARAIESLTHITKENRSNIPATESLVNIYYQQKNFEAALRESNKLTKLVILNPKYIAQKAEIYIALQDLNNANKQLKVLSGTLTSAQEFYQLSQLQFKAQNINDGKLTLAHALSLQPKSTVLLLETAKIEMLQGNLAKSNEILVALEKNRHNDANVLLIRGDWLLRKNQKEAAHKKYLSALKIDNNFNAALVRLYKLTLDNIGTDIFSSTLTMLLKQQPNRHFIRNLLADHLLNIGDTVNAKSHYEILVKQDYLPTKSIILNNLANILIKTDLQYAEETAQQALALDNTSSAILDTYGWIKSLRGNHPESLVLLRHAFSMNSNDPAINYHLGYTLMKLGRLTEAKQELMHALAAKSDFLERSDAETLLKSISN
jgi:putative PEP-CTERM system TPR-repeat lipoprotein